LTSSGPTSQEQRALRRAQQALLCLPFRRDFYRQLEQGALSSSQLAGRQDWLSLSRRRLSAGQAEDHFIWLIQLGVLRREVDGQGLTERVRLTPLGRQLLASWPDQRGSADLFTKLWHWCRRHWPRW
jgi:hypothetical protein